MECLRVVVQNASAFIYIWRHLARTLFRAESPAARTMPNSSITDRAHPVRACSPQNRGAASSVAARACMHGIRAQSAMHLQISAAGRQATSKSMHMRAFAAVPWLPVRCGVPAAASRAGVVHGSHSWQLCTDSARNAAEAVRLEHGEGAACGAVSHLRQGLELISPCLRASGACLLTSSYLCTFNVPVHMNSCSRSCAQEAHCSCPTARSVDKQINELFGCLAIPVLKASASHPTADMLQVA